MSTWQERLDNAAGDATCQILSGVGSTLVTAGAWNLATGGAGLVPITLGSAALLASNYACTWDPDASGTYPTDDLIAAGSCMEANGCGLHIEGKGGQLSYLGIQKKLISVLRTGTYPNGTAKVTTTYVDCNGVTQSDDEAAVDILPISTRLEPGFTCVGDPAPEPDPVIPPYEYVEPGPDGCSLTVNFLGFGQEPGGKVAPIYMIEPTPTGLRGGGVIGGCNFEPTIYYQPTPPPGGPGGGGDDGCGGEPPYIIPYVPGDDPDGTPFWLEALREVLAGAAGALLAEQISDLFEQPYQGVTYEMTAPCNVDAEGNPLVWTGEIPQQKFNEAVLDRLDAISAQISQALAWKTPICTHEPTQLEGDFRTISFISDETSPFGKSRLRKRLRYRSLNGHDLSPIVDHWKDFEWQSGPTRVRWTGGSWGTVEVWASTDVEGQRVIQHAAGEAGFDAFETGGWSIRTTSSTRLGVSGTMRVNTKGGYWWITSRDGSNNRPIVAMPSD